MAGKLDRKWIAVLSNRSANHRLYKDAHAQ